jgi:hypothetical protein
MSIAKEVGITIVTDESTGIMIAIEKENDSRGNAWIIATAARIISNCRT